MSSPLGPTPAPATAGGAPAGAAAARAAAAPRDSLLVRLCAFGALAAFGAAHWVMLVVDAPAGRTLLVVLTAVGGGARARAARPAAAPAPAHLGARRARGGGHPAPRADGRRAAGPAAPARALGRAQRTASTAASRGSRESSGPTTGPDPWIRLTILLGAPLLLAIAATLAFWPARRAAPVLRIAGLAVLLLFYGAAVTEHDPGSPLGRGLVLLLLVAAYLWLPRLPAREAGFGGGRGGRRRRALAAVRGRARRRRRLVGLPGLELVRRGQGRDLRLEPRVRPARLAARGHDADERLVRPPALLEGGDARRLRRLPLVPLRRQRPGAAPGPSSPSTASRRTAPSGTTASTTAPGTRRSTSRSARCRATWWWAPA